MSSGTGVGQAQRQAQAVCMYHQDREFVWLDGGGGISALLSLKSSTPEPHSESGCSLLPVNTGHLSVLQWFSRITVFS